MVDPSALCVAVAPLAVYFGVLGWLNLRRRPYLLSGARETTALALALSGVVIVGPMQLFMPENAAGRFGVYVWVLLLSFYGLSISLSLLLSRPRLVIYNCSAAQAKRVLAEIAPALDSQASWQGDTLLLPDLRVQLQIERFAPLRNVCLRATGDEQDFDGWRNLEFALRAGLQQQPVNPNPRGFTFLTLAVVLTVIVVRETTENPRALAEGLMTLLRM